MLTKPKSDQCYVVIPLKATLYTCAQEVERGQDWQENFTSTSMPPYLKQTKLFNAKGPPTYPDRDPAERLDPLSKDSERNENIYSGFLQRPK